MKPMSALIFFRGTIIPIAGRSGFPERWLLFARHEAN